MMRRPRTFSESFVHGETSDQPSHRYVCFAADVFATMAKRLHMFNSSRFKYFPISWDKFPDGTDNITISGFIPRNEIAGEHVIFFASFHNNDVTLSQISVLIVLLQSFIESLTIVLPFYPVGTNERVEVEGKVATANTYATLLSGLPPIGRPIRIMIYDIHALQNRFYFHGTAVASLHTSVPLILNKMRALDIKAVCFPDEGAAKRFGNQFKDAGMTIIICGKVRDGHLRRVTIQDGDPNEKEVVIIDDLVQTGGTLYECAMALKAMGAKSIFAFVTHAVFPNSSWQLFSKNLGGSRAVFDKFFTTNSVASVTDHLPKDDVFEVLDLLPQIMTDLEMVR